MHRVHRVLQVRQSATCPLYSHAVKRLAYSVVLLCSAQPPCRGRRTTIAKPAGRARSPRMPRRWRPPAQAELVKQYCTGCHNERGKAGELSLAGWDVTRASAERELTEKMIHKLRAGMMPPSGARRPARRTARAVGRRARIAHGRARGRRSESGLAPVPAPEPRRVRARDPAPARPRRRRHRVPARRHDQRRLRQRRRRADVLADADGRLPARRQPHRDAGDRRSRQLGDPGDLQAAEDRVADGARRRRAARHARRHLGRPHLPGRRRLRVQHGLLRRAARASCSATRVAGRADRGLARRRAARDLRHQPADERREDRADGQDRADAASRPARIA